MSIRRAVNNVCVELLLLLPLLLVVIVVLLLSPPDLRKRHIPMNFVGPCARLAKIYPSLVRHVTNVASASSGATSLLERLLVDLLSFYCTCCIVEFLVCRLRVMRTSMSPDDGTLRR